MPWGPNRHPRSALAVIMRGDSVEGWLAHFGLKCSTWTAVNAGTSGRSACSSIGNTDHPSVREGNCLGSRIFAFAFMPFGWYPKIIDREQCLTNIGASIFESDLAHHFPAFRMLLLMMVAVCLNACIMLEQPFSSFFEYYPRFRDFIMRMMEHGGKHAVPCQLMCLLHNCYKNITSGMVWVYVKSYVLCW